MSTPSEPGQPTSPKPSPFVCRICGERMKVWGGPVGDGWVEVHIRCPDECALAAKLPKT